MRTFHYNLANAKYLGLIGKQCSLCIPCLRFDGLRHVGFPGKGVSATYLEKHQYLRRKAKTLFDYTSAESRAGCHATRSRHGLRDCLSQAWFLHKRNWNISIGRLADER